MKREASGSWSTATSKRLENVRYLYEVKVFAPTVQKVVTNLVTDPYSVALTLNSTRSVAVNLANPAWAPKQWTQTASPKLAQTVDAIMTRSPKCCRPDQLVSEVIEMLNTAKITAIFVVEGNRPVGVVHLHDLLRIGVA